jgi:hypothetical protein
VTTKTEQATAHALAELRAALEAEQAARKDMRRALPDYCPEIIEMSLHEDESLVLSDFKASHPELGADFDFELVSFNMLAPRDELCTPASRARGEARAAELAAREARARAERSAKFQADPAAYRTRYATPEEEAPSNLSTVDKFAEPQEQRGLVAATRPAPAEISSQERERRVQRQTDLLGMPGFPSRFSWMR